MIMLLAWNQPRKEHTTWRSCFLDKAILYTFGRTRDILAKTRNALIATYQTWSSSWKKKDKGNIEIICVDWKVGDSWKVKREEEHKLSAVWKSNWQCFKLCLSKCRSLYQIWTLQEVVSHSVTSDLTEALQAPLQPQWFQHWGHVTMKVWWCCSTRSQTLVESSFCIVKETEGHWGRHWRATGIPE